MTTTAQPALAPLCAESGWQRRFSFVADRDVSAGLPHWVTADPKRELGDRLGRRSERPGLVFVEASASALWSAKVRMSGDDEASYWMGAVEADQVAALRAFRRPPSDMDRGLATEPSTASDLPLGMNLSLARRVYAGPEGTIDVVPGPGLIGCVVSVAGTGERMSGSTSTELVARGSHGFISGGADRLRTFRGVLGAEVRDLRVITGDGATEIVSVNADDGYWTTIGDPAKAILTLIDGTEHEIPFVRVGSDRRRGQPDAT